MTSTQLINALFLSRTDSLGADSIAACLGLAALEGAAIGLVYQWAHSLKQLPSALIRPAVLMTMLMAMVTLVIDRNIALAIGLVGAFSAIRFRTPLESHSELMLVFSALVAGMAIGSGLFWQSAAATALVALQVALLAILRQWVSPGSCPSWFVVRCQNPAGETANAIRLALGGRRRRATYAACRQDCRTGGVDYVFMIEGRELASETTRSIGVLPGVLSFYSTPSLPCW